MRLLNRPAPDPPSVRRHGATTRREADRTTRDAGRRATDGRQPPPGPHAGSLRGAKRRPILPRPRLKLQSRTRIRAWTRVVVTGSHANRRYQPYSSIMVVRAGMD